MAALNRPLPTGGGFYYKVRYNIYLYVLSDWEEAIRIVQHYWQSRLNITVFCLDRNKARPFHNTNVTSKNEANCFFFVHMLCTGWISP